MLAGPTDQIFENTRFRLERSQNSRMAGSMPVFGKTDFAAKIAESEKTASDISALEIDSPAETAVSPEKDEGTFGFLDFLDIINPLQHIPVVSTIYQHVTGDTIKPAAEIFGGALFGGPVGAMAGAVTTIAKAAIQHHDSDTSSEVTQVATALADTNATLSFADLRKGLTPYNS